MDDLDENFSSTGFEPLFIKEEDGHSDRPITDQQECKTKLSGLTFTSPQSALMNPYLQEMNDLLKSCEELVGIPFGSSKSSHNTEEVTMESQEETCVSPQGYLSTSYMDTHMDGVESEHQPEQSMSQSMGTIINRCGDIPTPSHQTEMPLTSVGNKLSESMVEYEGQLLGMLAMVESCMEEVGMDFDPQEWAIDASQEYVHISKNPQFHKSTTLVPIQQEKMLKQDSHPIQVECHVSQQEEYKSSEESRKRKKERQQISWPEFNKSEISVERSSDFKTDQRDTDSQINFSEETIPMKSIQDNLMYCEGTKSGEGKEDVAGIEVYENDLQSEERHEVKIDTFNLGCDMTELEALGSQMEDCIEEVQRLEERRKELLTEVLQLRGNDIQGGREEEQKETEEQIDRKVADLLNVLKNEDEGRREEKKRVMQSLREERAKQERSMWKVNLERQGLQDEHRKLKRQLFTTARQSAHSQAALHNQRREVELLRREVEKLNSLLNQLSEEHSQLRSGQQKLLSDLRKEIHAQTSNQTPNTQEELSECRRHSCGDIQQYLQGGLRALEERYEPILLALLKRRESTAGALVKTKEQAQELRAQLRPLRVEIEKLILQKTCLEEKLKLIHIQRREEVGQYKETVFYLEESSRELKTELKIQKKKNKEMEELRDNLTKYLLLFRTATEDHSKSECMEIT
ncbi:uncharacterized protein sync [Pholidichthys leucotaenia]